MVEKASALGDIRVLDLSRLLPGPYCSMLLADMGADVIKVEAPDGGDYLRWWPPLVDGTSALFAPLNRNKRSIILDLKSDLGRQAFLELAETTDVVVESFRPGVMDRLGIGWETLHERNPKLILCSISGFGQDGPYSDRAGHDLNFLAVSGALGTTGTRDGDLAIPGVQVGDLGGGAANATIAILAALHARTTTGAGQHCDVSMTDGLVSWLAIHFGAYFATGDVPGPAGQQISGKHPCYAIYECSDGAIAVAALEPKFWTELVSVLELPHLADSAFAEGERGALTFGELSQLFATNTRAHWMEILEGHDVCVEAVLRFDEVIAHPQVQYRGLVVAPGVSGPQAQIGFPFRLLDTPLQTRTVAPRYGEHTAEVLQGAGFSDDAMTRLVSVADQARGAVAPMADPA